MFIKRIDGIVYSLYKNKDLNILPPTREEICLLKALEEDKFSNGD